MANTDLHEASQTRGMRNASLLVPVLAGFVAGSGLQLQQAALWTVMAYGGLLAAAMVAGMLARFGKPRCVSRVFVFMAAAVLAFGSCGLRSAAFMAQGLAPGLQGQDIVVTGVVAAMPQRGEDGVRFRLEVESAQLNGADVQLPPQLYLGWYHFGGSSDAQGDVPGDAANPADLRAGERWRMTVRLKQPHGGSNPHGFDYELWLWEQGLQATGHVRAGRRESTPQRIGVTWQHPVERARQAVRDAVFERVADRKLAGIIAALVAGDQGAIERADWDVFRATGVAHLMSISGLHVTMFAWAAGLLVGWLWRRSDVLGASLCLRFPAPSAGLLGGVLLAAAYALFSGWGVPAQRTVCMLAVVGLLRLGGRRWPWPCVWLLACAAVVALDPWALMQPGFWLSFVAVGVLFAAGPAQEHGEPEQGGIRANLWRRVLAAAREQWTVTLALTPLSLLLFGQVSVVGLLANALAIPWVTLVVTPLAMLGVVWAPLWDVAALALQVLVAALRWLASWPLASVSMAAPAPWAGAAGLAGGILLALRLPWPLRWLGLPLVLPALLWQAPRPDPGQFELLAADVGQGNAVIVRTASHALVYDTGPRFGRDSDAGNRVLVPLLRALGERVDTVVLSHRDADHTGGAQAVLAMQPDAALLSSLEDGHELLALRPGTRCIAGQQWVWDGVRFEILQPQAADYAVTGAMAVKSNGLSCVLRISAAGQGGSALLAGDIEEPQEARLVRQGGLRPADFLLVPHHGSKTSSSAAFLDAVQPHVALAQAGYRNRFGHPAPAVAERYKVGGVLLADSAHCGAARWVSEQPQALACQRETGRRYWNHVVP